MMRIKGYIGTFIAICIVILICSFFVFAQDKERPARVYRYVNEGRPGEGSDTIIVLDGEHSMEQKEMEVQVVPTLESGKDQNVKVEQKAEKVKSEVEKPSPGDFQKDKTSEQSFENMFPPQLRDRIKEIMKKENISPDALKDPEVRRNLMEKARGMNIDERGKESPQPPQRGRMRGGSISSGGGEDLRQYIDSIVNKNLFLPLGSGQEEKRPSYALTAVISNTSSESDSKAIIEQVGGQKSYYVSEGDNLDGDTKVAEIEEMEVKIDASGNEITLKLGEGTRGGGKSSRPGGRPPEMGRSPDKGKSFSPPSGGSDRRSGSSGDFKLPPQVQKMLEERGISIEELRNNPELQNKLREEFMRNRPEQQSGEMRMRIRAR